ncbi:hypothetical protein [Desertibaculum subflavum]|uniref:hypothetical protein n=1 Tax=Desertibaculum subflavum TaxID=2268458 RepID=UPI0013C414EA
MESQANIRMLKAVVIVLGLLIVASIGVIGVTVFRRLSDTGPPPARLTTAPASAPANGSSETNGERSSGVPLPIFGERRVELPQGARLVETRITGDRMFLRARLLGGNEVWIVLSLLTGQQLGSFELIAE